MLRSSLLILVSLVAFACSKEKAKETPASPPTPAGSDATATTGSGSADSGSGSAMAGSGSAMAGSDTAMAGSGSAMAGSADGSAAGSGSATDAPVGDFDKLSQEDKVKVMKQKVMPAMRAAFQKFDPKEFSNFTCKTCHGKDPVKAKHEMPTPDLPKLDFAKIKAGKEDKEWLEFMGNVVKPEMAKILGKPEMTETQPGFGCLDCHMEKK